jgi:hypothetical protein
MDNMKHCPQELWMLDVKGTSSAFIHAFKMHGVDSPMIVSSACTFIAQYLHSIKKAII